jgi:hypothetical protein
MEKNQEKEKAIWPSLGMCTGCGYKAAGKIHLKWHVIIIITWNKACRKVSTPPGLQWSCLGMMALCAPRLAHHS